MNYMDVKTAAKRWNLTERRLTMLCRNGRIEGAKKEGGIWLIPTNATKPKDGRSSKAAAIMKNTKKLPMPIGISDFKQLVSKYYYVDKTLMIKEFIDNSPKVSLFTRPRRFLKSATKILRSILKTKKYGVVAKDTARNKANTQLFS